MTVIEWKPCKPCGATTRHDDGRCIRHPGHQAQQRHPGSLGATLQLRNEHVKPQGKK